MAYEPTITSAKLNKMEQGIANSGGGVLVVTADAETGALDKTWQEIYDAASDSKVIIIKQIVDDGGGIGYMTFSEVSSYQGEYVVCALVYSGSLEKLNFITNSASGYPVYQQN